MKGFVADEHIALTTIHRLREAGFQVISVREDMRGVDDRTILEYTERHGLVLITNDKDFSDLIFKEKIPFTAGLIFCRLHRVMPADIAELILSHISDPTAEFVGKLTVLAKDKFRRRKL